MMTAIVILLTVIGITLVALTIHSIRAEKRQMQAWEDEDREMLEEQEMMDRYMHNKYKQHGNK